MPFPHLVAADVRRFTSISAGKVSLTMNRTRASGVTLCSASSARAGNMGPWFTALLALTLTLTLAGCSPSGPPTHGTLFVLQIETNRPNQTVTPQSSRKVEGALRARLDKLGVRSFFESSGQGQLAIKVALKNPETLTTIRQVLT